MGRGVYLFELDGIHADYKQVVNEFLSLGYSLTESESGLSGLFLEKKLSNGIVEMHISDYENGFDVFMRIAKPNSEETVSVLLNDVIGLKKQFTDLFLYDVEAKQKVDLNDEKLLREKFSKARLEFLGYFSNANKAPVRGDDVFKKR